MSEILIRIDNGSKSYGSHAILGPINLSIQKGEFVTLLGPSGCGKSTLLRLLARMEPWTKGTMSFSDSISHSDSVALLNSSHGKLGFVFQEPQLLSWRTVFENIQLPLELSPKTNRFNQKEQRERVYQVLEKVKLTEAAHKFPHQLSGGMKMRVSIARALITEPLLLFMDEPFAALDEPTREELQEQLWELKTLNKTTMIFVTHSLQEATFLSERIYFMGVPNSGSSASTILADYQLLLPPERTYKLRSDHSFFEELRKVRQLMRTETSQILPTEKN